MATTLPASISGATTSLGWKVMRSDSATSRLAKDSEFVSTAMFSLNLPLELTRSTSWRRPKERSGSARGASATSASVQLRCCARGCCVEAITHSGCSIFCSSMRSGRGEAPNRMPRSYLCSATDSPTACEPMRSSEKVMPGCVRMKLGMKLVSRPCRMPSTHPTRTWPLASVSYSWIWPFRSASCVLLSCA
ncbi:hypothetical protein D9M72_497680 [compost metagenome]